MLPHAVLKRSRLSLGDALSIGTVTSAAARPMDRLPAAKQCGDD
jgi:hypothetical protein